MNNDDIPTYIALGIASTGYAARLNTEIGKRFADEYTWASAVVGSGLILQMLRFILPRQYWEKVGLAFVVAGIPLIARSFINKLS